MAFGYIRIREIKAKEIGATDIHNSRKYADLGIAAPDNINTNKSHMNETLYIKQNLILDKYQTNLIDVIENRIKESGVKVRNNSVIAIEFMCSASKEFFEAYSAAGWFTNCRQWLENRYGVGNVIAQYNHYDESNPHAHFIVLPIIQKEVRWKNTNGEGKKIENRLCARDLTGNKEKLTKLQDDYFNFIKPFGKKYGVDFYRGTKATNQLISYTKQTNHILGEFRNRLNELDKLSQQVINKLNNNEISNEEAQLIQNNIHNEIMQISAQKLKIEEEEKRLRDEAAKREKARELQNKDGKWKKRGGLDIEFH